MTTVAEMSLWLSHQSIRHSKLAPDKYSVVIFTYGSSSAFGIYVVKLQTIVLPLTDQFKAGLLIVAV